jgi:hypothetical protein
MELTELQSMWVQYGNKIAENTRINKEILKSIIKTKTEKKINWIKFKAILNILYPIPLIIFAASDIEYRMDREFIIGIILSGSGTIITYIWAIKYYLFVDKIDFFNPITTIKKDISKLEKYKLKITKLGFFVAPFFITGIFLVANVSVFSKRMIPFDLLAILIMAITVYLTHKHGIFRQIKRINLEIDEILELEKE